MPNEPWSNRLVMGVDRGDVGSISKGYYTRRYITSFDHASKFTLNGFIVHIPCLFVSACYANTVSWHGSGLYACHLAIAFPEDN